MPFDLRESDLADMFAAANFEVPKNEMVFFGLRGCTPVDESGTDFASSHKLELLGTDYLHMRCTFGQWRPGSGFAVFPGSTVPHLSVIKSAVKAGGAGVNQLALGYYSGPRKYYKGDHKRANPSSRHRAFRNDAALPVWRTSDDVDYDGDDEVSLQTVYDNIHCAWQLNVAAPSYSSNGCQVIAGRPLVEARGWTTELGPWAKFVRNGYDASQPRFAYALFSGREALKVAELGSRARPQTVRFGSTGPLVKALQAALIDNGYDLGDAGADGDMGLRTLRAIRSVQLKAFGAAAVDLIVGPATAAELGLQWPKFGEAVPSAPALVTAVAAAKPAPAPNPTGSDEEIGPELQKIADDLGVEAEALMAVALVESGGKLFGPDGRPLIRWEGHYFYRILDGKSDRQGLKAAVTAGLASVRAGGVKNPRDQADRYALLERAKRIDEDAALCSCSWGAGQVMGENWKRLKFKSVQELVERCMEGAAGQIDVMARFIKASHLVDELKEHRWRDFALAYNGPNAIEGGYDRKIEERYESLVGRRRAGEGRMWSAPAKRRAA